MTTVLVVEDNLHIRENVTEMLEIAGYNVLSAPNGKVGLDLARSKLPDIILSDVMMPVLNGHQLFSELKKDEITKNIPFILITSSVEKKEVQAALDKGVDGYIMKPFEEKALFETISRCLMVK